ncbi:thymic stromal lymphopoietin isoform X4 [Fukomys damarensis]|uniref:thymic stromal lymphopoietin isoform X4 n=1 Tax=Fukomys damarensis TaxID=885580 RepID=UPI00053F4C5C|nr:thymic stromal lymphopoietin isoform X4 [Fukomys damarensis]
MNKTRSTDFNHVACYKSADCLAKIERHTFSSTTCPSLSEELFALRTNATLARYCPGYFKVQINNTQKVQRKVNRNCLEQTSQIIGWWRFFSRHLKK